MTQEEQNDAAFNSISAEIEQLQQLMQDDRQRYLAEAEQQADGTAAYFKAAEDPSGLMRVGGRMGLDLDGDGTETNDAGWERRAVFVIDRTELLNAFDEGTGNFDWQRLIKYRADLPSDSK